MPDMNGIEAVKIIRKTVDYFPIMAYTSNLDYKKVCYDVGMDDFAIKPCRPGDLFARINKQSVKLYKFITKPNGLVITELMPVNQKHAQEIKHT